MNGFLSADSHLFGSTKVTCLPPIPSVADTHCADLDLIRLSSAPRLNVVLMSTAWGICSLNPCSGRLKPTQWPALPAPLKGLLLFMRQIPLLMDQWSYVHRVSCLYTSHWVSHLVNEYIEG